LESFTSFVQALPEVGFFVLKANPDVGFGPAGTGTELTELGLQLRDSRLKALATTVLAILFHRHSPGRNQAGVVVWQCSR
jgi:hypothetical protein